MIRWAILTGEYPPDPGGVSDYTRLVARGLAAAGDGVRVYAPPSRGTMVPDDPGVAVCRLPGRFGPRSLLVLERLLAEHPRPDRVLVQYVPHAFGFKAMNLPFAKWIATRSSARFLCGWYFTKSHSRSGGDRPRTLCSPRPPAQWRGWSPARPTGSS